MKFQLLLVLILASCTQKPKPDLLSRMPSMEVDSISTETARIVYSNYDALGKVKHDEITIERWRGDNGGFTAGGREDYLVKMFFANTVRVSSRGLLHTACFYGSAQTVQELFFANEVQPRNSLTPVETRASQDGRRLGIKLNHKSRGPLFFRLAHCLAGKSTIADSLKLAVTNKKQREPAQTWLQPARHEAKGGGGSSEKGAIDSGFIQLHTTAIDTAKYPTFALRADFKNIPLVAEKKPWEGLNLRDPKDSLKFTLLVQKYFYENMANQNSKNNDFNFIAQKNQARYWCHMPWMNVGVTGREAIHGLTQERDLKPSTTIPSFKNSTPGTNWGVAYFNAEGCQTIRDVFGSSDQPKVTPDFTQTIFPDGTLITKMLFTTAEFPDIKNAYSWKAHVSEVGSSERSIRQVRHIQMDIAVKDSSLIGISPILQNWAMAAFYYDETYDYDKEYKDLLNGMELPIKAIPNLPQELLKMRPIGVQTGYDNPITGETITFAGAFTNGTGGRLNGPADNPKTSCLGCHGAAGTQAKMVPGFLSLKMFEPFKTATNLDFNQQLSLAKSNFETLIP